MALGTSQPPDTHVIAAATGGVVASRRDDRRHGFRVCAQPLAVRAWRMDAHARLIDRVYPSQRVPLLRAVDIGRGGMGVVVPSVCLMHRGDRLHLELPIDVHGGTDSPDNTLVCEGRVVYVAALREEECRIGLQFAPALSETLARRFDHALDRILSTLQREALRRLHAASPADGGLAA